MPRFETLTNLLFWPSWWWKGAVFFVNTWLSTYVSCYCSHSQLVYIKVMSGILPHFSHSSAEALRDRHMLLLFLLVNVSPVWVKNIVAGIKYWLKLSVSCDLLEIILCTQGPEASESSHKTRSLPAMFSKQNSECENFHCHWQQNWVWLQSVISVKGDSSVHDQLFFPHQHWRRCTSLHIN